MNREQPPSRWPIRNALRLSLICLLTFHFQGCKQEIELTGGPIAPFVQVEYNNDDALQSQLTYFSVPRLVLNLAGLTLLFVVLPVWVPGVGRLWSSRRFHCCRAFEHPSHASENPAAKPNFPPDVPSRASGG